VIARRSLAADQSLHEIERREDQKALNPGNEKDDLGESHGGVGM
jgi:hypothetical protein